jgi:threonine synthase
MTDRDFVDLVERLDKEVAGVDGRGFTVTPFGRSEGLSERLGFHPPGGVWVKDETGGVSGSHKARHLMGLAILLDVVDRLGLRDGADAAPELAIASCGNAALAAAVVARAAGRPLRVFVPTWADAPVVSRLKALEAELVVCPREEGVAGDPTYHRLQEAIRAGALPFTCQGPDNGLTIEGGETLGYEMVSDLLAAGTALDRVMVQVGGGALASACIQAFRDARSLGAVDKLPRFDAVQTAGGYPLKRAYDLLARRLLERMGERPDLAGTADGAERILAAAGSSVVQDELQHAAGHRSEFMWPWEEEPRSVAQGILDDETYDWLAVVRGMVETGGYPVVVSEAELEEANRLALQATGIDVDHTGSSGLAGLLGLHRAGAVQATERVAVLFTGVRR